MPASRGARAFACAALLMTVAFAAASPAVAKKTTRASTVATFDAASLIPIPQFSGKAAREPQAVMKRPATFFTIASALAKHDGRRIDNAVKLAAVDSTEIVMDVTPQPAVSSARGDEPFGMQAFRAPEGLLWSKWRRLTQEVGEEEKVLSSCSSGSCGRTATAFFDHVNQIKSLNGRARLEKLNRIVNSSIAYASDLSLHGELDRWSAPLATIQAGRGDCEDYAILKRQILIHAGAMPTDLRIVLLRDTAVRLDHAVLAARADGQWFILDNRKSGFYAERDLPHYMPLFALDQNGVKLFAVPFANLPAPQDDTILPGLDTELSGATGGLEFSLTPLL
jgi:predicted transglutaminase-like cysteine proteinase